MVARSESLSPAIKAVHEITTGYVEQYKEHRYGSSKPLMWWVLTSRSWVKAPITAYAFEHRDGRSANFRLSVFHEDIYVMTVVPTVAMIKQILNGQIKPGIHLMGLCCDSEQPLDDIGRTDVSITQWRS